MYHSSDGTGRTLSSSTSSLGATDLITGGDWTVPREGPISLFFRKIKDSASGLEVSYSKARVSIALLFWAWDLRGLKKHAAERMAE